MAEQLDLLAPSRDSDPVESRAAARKVKAQDQFNRVLVWLLHAEERGWGAQTDDEIAEALDLLRNSAGTRRGIAVKRGLVERAGVATTPRGFQCATWRLTDEGKAEARRLLVGLGADR